MATSAPLVIFTTAPTGLGHLRVMDALIHGLPTHIQWIDIGLQNFRANKIHALGSRIPFLIKLTEFYQTDPTAESIVAGIYTLYLRSRTNEIKKYFSAIATSRPDKKQWIIVCTHFSLAHSIAAAKATLEKYFDVKIVLCVIVTDDSPQRMWAVDGADLIFVPSDNTHQQLAKYLKRPDCLRTVSFPLSPKFSQLIPPNEYELLKAQFSPIDPTPLHIQIPISGAAVQLQFFYQLMTYLSEKKTIFTIIGQQTKYTSDFFNKIARFPRAEMGIGLTARETVDYYEAAVLSLNRSSIEITKPSEQMFKALIPPSQRGGLVLLLTPPIGRQEYDNVAFLRRHKLMPSEEEEKQLLALLANGKTPSPSEVANWQYKASHWRALNLPTDPLVAAKLIIKLRDLGIFLSMLSFVSEEEAELTPNGVSQIWEEVLRHSISGSQ